MELFTGIEENLLTDRILARPQLSSSRLAYEDHGRGRASFFVVECASLNNRQAQGVEETLCRREDQLHGKRLPE